MFVIGIDFDNTLVQYDRVFYDAAVERLGLPREVPAVKNSVRDFLRRAGREDEWTELQGHVYGLRMAEAPAFPGALEAVRDWVHAGHKIYVVSHKTETPYRGEPYDLHAAAFGWLEGNGFFDSRRIGISRENVFFEPTKRGKLERIITTRCTHFIDDLPEVFLSDGFPAGVKRFLFDPNQEHRNSPFPTAASWSELARVMIGEEFAAEGDGSKAELLRGLLASVPVTSTFQIRGLGAGRNNRAFEVMTADGKEKFLLKEYFRHPDDPRERLKTEFEFLRFAWDNGLRNVPRPIARDDRAGMALFEYISGRQPVSGEITALNVAAAAEFLRRLNLLRDRPDASDLPAASEACFTLNEHLDCVRRRVERLRPGNGETVTDDEARAFVDEELAPAWSRVREAAVSFALRHGMDRDERLARSERVLSPSDFGFHNAILDELGELRFVDFEYAGWDDPAKTVCDFFCQPAIPVALNHLERFADSVASVLPSGREQFVRRVEALLPVYRIKWCCIVLNDFLPGGAARRRFSAVVADAALRTRQLELARRFLSS